MDVLVVGWRWSLLRACKIDFAMMFCDWVQVILLTYSMCTKTVGKHGFALCIFEKSYFLHAFPWSLLVCDWISTWLQDLVEPLKFDLTCAIHLWLLWFMPTMLIHIGESWGKTWVILWGFWPLIQLLQLQLLAPLAMRQGCTSILACRNHQI